jgi:hypothetical protein
MKMRIDGFTSAMYEYAAYKREGEKGFTRFNLLSFNKGHICRDYDEAFEYWHLRFLRYMNADDAAVKAAHKAEEENKQYMRYYEYLISIKADTDGLARFLERKKLTDKRRKLLTN